MLRRDALIAKNQDLFLFVYGKSNTAFKLDKNRTIMRCHGEPIGRFSALKEMTGYTVPKTCDSPPA